MLCIMQWHIEIWKSNNAVGNIIVTRIDYAVDLTNNHLMSFPLHPRCAFVCVCACVYFFVCLPIISLCCFDSFKFSRIKIYSALTRNQEIKNRRYKNTHIPLILSLSYFFTFFSVVFFVWYVCFCSFCFLCS